MPIDPIALYGACAPDVSLDVANKKDRQYYIDFSPVREGQVVEDVCKKISWERDKPTCQLFTGHTGCGKSTELSKLRSQLDEKGFEVVLFEPNMLDMGNLEVTDILVVMACEVGEKLKEMIPEPETDRFRDLFDGAKKIFMELGIPIPGTEGLGIGVGAFRIFGKWLERARDNPTLRTSLHRYLEPQANWLSDAINEELLTPVTQALKEKGRNGLAVIIDGLDRIETNSRPGEKTLPEHLFLGGYDKLKKPNCHIVYTIPLELYFSGGGLLAHRFEKCHVLPMIPVEHRDGRENRKGMDLLCDMLMVRAFPGLDENQCRDRLMEIFDTPETADRLCHVSGGNVRYLLTLFRRSILREERLPITGKTLEYEIRELRNEWIDTIRGDEWNLLRAVKKEKEMDDHEKYLRLMRNVFVVRYRDSEGSWFDVNPILKEAKKLSGL